LTFKVYTGVDPKLAPELSLPPSFCPPKPRE